VTIKPIIGCDKPLCESRAAFLFGIAAEVENFPYFRLKFLNFGLIGVCQEYKPINLTNKIR